MTLRRRLLLQAAAASAFAAPLTDARAAASQDGSWLDGRRQRTVPWRLRLPAGPGPWPWVIYSHGLGGSREGGAVWGQAWADAGTAVLHLQHAGSDSETLRGGLGSLRAGASAEQWLARVLDVRFALDEVERLAGAALAPWHELRRDAVGMAGHSFGAHTTQALAGQRFPAATDAAEPRLRAFVALSPSAPRGADWTVQQAFGGVQSPFLAITGSLDGDPFGSYDGGDSRARVYDGLPLGQRALLWLQGADHMSFGGGSVRRVQAFGPFRRHGSAAEQEPAHHALVARITMLWWRAHLLGDAQALAALRAPQPLGEGDRFVLG